MIDHRAIIRYSKTVAGRTRACGNRRNYEKPKTPLGQPLDVGASLQDSLKEIHYVL